jgi:23S rRNA (cytosine1962-C5)-methyltransferase
MEPGKQHHAGSAAREAMVGGDATNCFRVIHGASDGWPGWYVDRLGGFFLSQSEDELLPDQVQRLGELAATVPGGAGVYQKFLNRNVRVTNLAEASPQHLSGPVAPERFVVRENGISFELSFSEGYSVGLFLDQRENRRRFLANEIAPGMPLFAGGGRGREVLNTFAYTCAFSVCAAKAGMRATSLDLSKKYLDWGRRNFGLNGIDPAANDFIYGDAFDWMRRLAKKQRRFDAIILDPPTFSKSKEYGFFRVEKDYARLVTAALPMLNSGGVLLASTNMARLSSEDFQADVRAAVRAAGRKIAKQFIAPQPADFAVSADEPAYLKSIWLRLA